MSGDERRRAMNREYQRAHRDRQRQRMAEDPEYEAEVRARQRAYTRASSQRHTERRLAAQREYNRTRLAKAKADPEALERLRAQQREWNRRYRERARAGLVVPKEPLPAEPVCTKCGIAKPAAQFAPDRSKASGRRSQCRDCANEARRARYQARRGRELEIRRDYYQRNRQRIHDRYVAVRQAAIDVYGGVCVLCGAADGLEFDHPDWDGGEHRQRERAQVMYGRIARLGRRIRDRRLRLLCRPCHQAQVRKAAA